MKRQSFLKGSAILMVMVIITKALGLMYKIPLTRILGGTGMGYFSGTYSLFTPIFAVIVSGIPSTLARLTSENYALKRYKNMLRQRLIAHAFFGTLSIAAAALTIGFSGKLTSAFISGGTKSALICIAPSMVFCTFMSVERGYYEGLQNMLPTAISEIVETVFRLVLGLGFALAVQNYGQEQFRRTGICFGELCQTAEQCSEVCMPYIVSGAILGSSVASMIAFLYILAIGKFSHNEITKDMLTDKPTGMTETVKILVTLAAPVAIVSLITTASNMIDMLTIPPLIVKNINNNESNFLCYYNLGISKKALPNFLYGSYTGLAMTIYGLVPTVTAMFGKGLLPAISSAYARGACHEVKTNLGKMLTVTSLIAIPSGLGVSVLSKPILQLLFGGKEGEIAAATMPLTLLGLPIIFMSISLPCLTILQTLGKPSKTVAIMVAGGLIKLAANLILVPIIGLNGAAAAEIISEFFILIASLSTIFRLFDYKCNVTETYIKPLYCGILCAAAAFLSQIMLENSRVIRLDSRICLIFSIVIGCIMYVFSMCLLCKMPKYCLKQLFGKKI